MDTFLQAALLNKGKKRDCRMGKMFPRAMKYSSKRNKHSARQRNKSIVQQELEMLVYTSAESNLDWGNEFQADIDREISEFNEKWRNRRYRMTVKGLEMVDGFLGSVFQDFSDDCSLNDVLEGDIDNSRTECSACGGGSCQDGVCDLDIYAEMF